MKRKRRKKVSRGVLHDITREWIFCRNSYWTTAKGEGRRILDVLRNYHSLRKRNVPPLPPLMSHSAIAQKLFIPTKQSCKRDTIITKNHCEEHREYLELWNIGNGSSDCRILVPVSSVFVSALRTNVAQFRFSSPWMIATPKGAAGKSTPPPPSLNYI